MNFTTLKLPKDVNSHLSYIFSKKRAFTLFRNKKFDNHFESKIVTKENILTPVTDFLKKQIENKGIVTTDSMLAEYYNYKVKGETISPFGWHTDSKQGPIPNCYTAVLYYHKSEKIKGGNLHYYNHGNDEIKCSVKANKYKGIAQLALFDGNVKHSVSDMSGKGIRQSVSFFIERQE